MLPGVSELDRARLQEMADGVDPGRAMRARIVLLAIQGVSDTQIAARLGISRKSAWRWRRRFIEGGPDAIEHERPRTGRKPTVQAKVSQQIVDTTLNVAPPSGKQWSTRTLGEFLGISRSMVHRVWRKHGIVPLSASKGKPPD